MRTGEFPRKKGDRAKSSECKGLIQPETRKSAQLKQKSCKAESKGFRVVIKNASLVQLPSAAGRTIVKFSSTN